MPVLERYVRREMACLAMTETDPLMAGNVRFSTSFSPSKRANESP